MTSKKSFTVLIAGGSIAGLTLANMLEKLDINYLILEAHSSIAPQVGASIGLFPTGLRIYDQLGLADKVKSLIKESLQTTKIRAPGNGILVSYPRIGDQFRGR